jgi:hypothetical protein
MATLPGEFPNLNYLWWSPHSPFDSSYNCIAWAAGDQDRKWWPVGPRAYWPHGAIKGANLEAFQSAFATLRYKKCDDGKHESGIEKIVFFQKNGEITHAARQLPNGTWTSKMGEGTDILHHTPEALEDPEDDAWYGMVIGYMSRTFLP